MIDCRRLIQTFIAVAMLFAPSVLMAGRGGPKVSLLGPTGLKGSVSGQSITVTEVAKGAPADGKIKTNDVIVGLNDAAFNGDPLRAIAAAIDVAESRKAGGKLTLSLKDKRKVDLKLRVLGSYSQTAPYKCKKTNTIISEMAESLLNSTRAGHGVAKSGILGLMATGEKKYLTAATQIIKAEKGDFAWVKGSDGKPMQGKIYSIWYWSYSAIVLTEYYLLTKDKSVLPAIRSLALTLALSQDAGGMYGHTPVRPVGRLHGYAQMNQPSLSAFMGMLLAQTCGVKDPVLDRAIATSYAYFENYVGKGGFGYGVGSGTTTTYNNNGTSGSAAICMALKKNSEGAQFFSQMAATSYDGFEVGHASTFFNPLWTPLGAHVSGPCITQQFFRKSLWYHNLRRRWNGGYGDEWKEGPQAGVALLAYCLPRRALLITGRGADKSNWLKQEEATEVIMMSQMDYKAKSDEELMSMLMNSPFPRVKRIASWTILKERRHLIPKWKTYLKTGTYKQKSLALTQYGMHTPLAEKSHLLKDLGAILRDEKAPVDVRRDAAENLGYHFKELAYPYYMDIVRLIAQDRPDDPYGDVDMILGRALTGICSTPFGNNLVTDKAVFYKAANKLLSYKRDKVSGLGATMLSDMTLEDFHHVGDKILNIAKNDDPTMHQYHGLHAVQPCIELLARLSIKEGIDCLENGFKGGRFNNELRVITRLLPLYEANAKSAADALEKKNPKMSDGRLGKQWLDAAKKIRADKNPRKLISFQEAMRAGE